MYPRRAGRVLTSRLPRRRLPRGRPRLLPDTRRLNLPAELTSFVGRRKGFRSCPGARVIAAAVADGRRGRWKTRLALRLASARAGVPRRVGSSIWHRFLAPIWSPGRSRPPLVSGAAATTARDALLDIFALASSCSCWITAST